MKMPLPYWGGFKNVFMMFRKKSVMTCLREFKNE